MRTGSFLLAALAGALSLAGASSSAQRIRLPAEASQPANDFAWKLLARQNMERDRKGAKRLKWSNKLAIEAQAWADRLAIENTMRHADSTTRGGAGENLWMGSAGYYSAEQMIDTFLAERADYRPGVFPQVSRTSRWEDVGHYTQIIWPGTQEVGCAISRGRENDFLVCRYWPAGNGIGARID